MPCPLVFPAETAPPHLAAPAAAPCRSIDELCAECPDAPDVCKRCMERPPWSWDDYIWGPVYEDRNGRCRECEHLQVNGCAACNQAGECTECTLGFLKNGKCESASYARGRAGWGGRGRMLPFHALAPTAGAHRPRWQCAVPPPLQACPATRTRTTASSAALMARRVPSESARWLSFSGSKERRRCGLLWPAAVICRLPACPPTTAPSPPEIRCTYGFGLAPDGQCVPCQGAPLCADCVNADTCTTCDPWVAHLDAGSKCQQVRCAHCRCSAWRSVAPPQPGSSVAAQPPQPVLPAPVHRPIKSCLPVPCPWAQKPPGAERVRADGTVYACEDGYRMVEGKTGPKCLKVGVGLSLFMKGAIRSEPKLKSEGLCKG